MAVFATTTVHVHMSCSNSVGGHGLDIKPGQVALLCFSVAYLEDRSDYRQFCVELKGPDKDEKGNSVPGTADSATTAAEKTKKAAEAAGVTVEDVDVDDPIEDFSVVFLGATEIDAACNYGKIQLTWSFAVPPLPPGVNITFNKPRVRTPTEPVRWPEGTPPSHVTWQERLPRRSNNELIRFPMEDVNGSLVVSVGPTPERAELREVWFPYSYDSPEMQARMVADALLRAGIDCEVSGASVLPAALTGSRTRVCVVAMRFPSPRGLANPPPFPWHWSIEAVAATGGARKRESAAGRPMVVAGAQAPAHPMGLLRPWMVAHNPNAGIVPMRAPPYVLGDVAADSEGADVEPVGLTRPFSVAVGAVRGDAPCPGCRKGGTRA